MTALSHSADFRFPPAMRAARFDVREINHLRLGQSVSARQFREHPFPHIALGPAPEAVADRCRRPVRSRTVIPAACALQDMKYRSLARASVGGNGSIFTHHRRSAKTGCDSCPPPRRTKENRRQNDWGIRLLTY